MALAWNNTALPFNAVDDRELDRLADKRGHWPRYNRALAADGRTLTMERQQHLDATGTLGPPVLDPDQARADYAKAARHARHARRSTRSEGGRSHERIHAKG